MANYNEENPHKKIDVIFFDDVTFQLQRLTRVINQPSGNILLIGTAGSGKQCLSKLASFIGKHVYFQITQTLSYNKKDFNDDLV